MGQRLPVSKDEFDKADVLQADFTRDMSSGSQVVHYKTPGGDFCISISKSDFEYLPNLMKKLEEFVHGCGYGYVKLRRKGEDYDNWTWEDTRRN